MSGYFGHSTLDEGVIDQDVCPTCSDFNFDDPTADSASRFPFSELVQTASDGCSKCHLLKTAIQSFHKLEDDSTALIEFAMDYNAEEPETREVILRLERSDGDGRYPPPSVELYRAPEDGFPSVFPSRSTLPEDTSSQQSFMWAREQLEACKREHEQCRSEAGTFLPTRVVDVSSSGGDLDVKVLVTNGLRAQYVALSHCWGDPKLMTAKLTAHTLASYQKRLHFDALPKTFQDAVVYTRRLGIQYLWIDSLCIIQRDEERDSPDDAELSRQDWMSESTKMCDVYENAHLTLAGASTTSSTTGLFFSPRDVTIIGCDNEHGQYKIHAREPPIHYQNAFPLLTRGWVMQETLLSPRTLFFGRHELLWHCRGTKSCQCTAGATDYVKALMGIGEFSDFVKLPKSDLQSQQYTQLNPVAQWHELVAVYSKTKLSFQSDKLAAIHGIVEYLRPLRTPDAEYLAGLWSDSLVSDLLWSIKGIPHGAVPEDGLRLRADSMHKTEWSSDRWLFPTWSWASTPHTVTWSIFHSTERVKPLVKRIITSIQHPPYQLWLRGVVVPSTLGAIHELIGGLARRGGVFMGSYEPDDGKQLDEYGPDREVFCLRMEDATTGGSYTSMVLVCTSHEKGEYERLGLLHSSRLHSPHSPDVEILPFWWDGEEGLEPKEKTIILT